MNEKQDAGVAFDPLAATRELVRLVAEERGALPGMACGDDPDDGSTSWSKKPDGTIVEDPITFGHIRRAVAELVPPPSTPEPADAGQVEGYVALSPRAFALATASRRFNKPMPEGDVDRSTHRMVGWIVPHEIAGLSDALFALEEIDALTRRGASLPASSAPQVDAREGAEPVTYLVSDGAGEWTFYNDLRNAEADAATAGECVHVLVPLADARAAPPPPRPDPATDGVVEALKLALACETGAEHLWVPQAHEALMAYWRARGLESPEPVSPKPADAPPTDRDAAGGASVIEVMHSIAILERDKADWIAAYNTVNALRLEAEAKVDEPSVVWLAENLKHQIDRKDDATAKAFITVARHALTSAQYDEMLELARAEARR